MLKHRSGATIIGTYYYTLRQEFTLKSQSSQTSLLHACGDGAFPAHVFTHFELIPSVQWDAASSWGKPE